MNCCTVLFCVFSSILLAETNAVTVKKIKESRNVTSEAQNDEMLPWDYETITSNLSDHSTPTPEPTTEKNPTISVTPAHTDRKTVETLDNKTENIDSRRLFNWLQKFLHHDQTVTTTENLHELLNPEFKTLEEPIVVAKVLTDAIINLAQVISKLTAVLQSNGQQSLQTPRMSQIPNNNVQVHRVLKKSYVLTPLANRRAKRDLTKTKTNVTKENDSKSGVHNSSNGTNNATNIYINKPLTPPSNVIILSNELRQTNGTLKSNETLPSNDTSKSQAVESSNDTQTTDVNPNNMGKVQTRRNANMQYYYITEKVEKETTQDIKTPQSEIKSKMLSYITDTFTEIEKKIKRVKGITRFVNSDYYKQGYLMANVDALETNAAYLKKDLDNHKEDWDEKSVLDAFDKVTITSKTLNNLIESLDKIKWVLTPDAKRGML